MQPDQTNILTAHRMKTRPSVFICAPSVGKYHRRSAFTMLEIMVVLAISIVLVSMLVVGFKYVVQSSNANSTKAAFESLKAMQANFEKSANGTNSSIPTAAMLGADAATTPTIVNQDNFGRYGPAITYTQAILYRLRSIPDNLTIIQNTASNKLYSVPLPIPKSVWLSGWTLNSQYSQNIALTLPNGTPPPIPNCYAANPSPWAAGTQYCAADLVIDPPGSTSVYVCVQDNFTPSGATTTCEPQSNSSYWTWVGSFSQATGTDAKGNAHTVIVGTSNLQNIPVFLDAWSNPILFVPAGGLLTNVPLAMTYPNAWVSGVGYAANAQVNAKVSGFTFAQNFICIQAHTSSASNAPPNSTYWKSALSPTNYRPFWVSAGPDGKFTDYTSPPPSTVVTPAATDDNMNSFDN